MANQTRKCDEVPCCETYCACYFLKKATLDKIDILMSVVATFCSASVAMFVMYWKALMLIFFLLGFSW